MQGFWGIEKNQRVVKYLPCLSVQLGNVVAGVLLSQILYWFRPDAQGKTKVKVKQDGKVWVAKHRKEMMEETGLTLWEYKQSIALLVKLGLIQYKRFGFAGKVTPHIWLDVPAMVHWLESDQSIGCNPTNPLGGNLPIPLDHWVESDQSNTEITITEIKDIEYLQGQAQKPQTQNIGDVEMGNAKQELEKKASAMPATYEALWKKEIGGLTGNYVKGLIGKEKGQLKQIVKVLEEAKMPVSLGITWTVRNWTLFCHNVKKYDGILGYYPSVPQLGFLLVHVTVLIYILQSIAKGNELEKEVPKEVVKVYEGKVVKIEVESSHITTQEDLDLIESLKKEIYT